MPSVYYETVFTQHSSHIYSTVSVCSFMSVCVGEGVIGQTQVLFFMCHLPCSLRKGLALAWSSPNRLDGLVSPGDIWDDLRTGVTWFHFCCCNNISWQKQPLRRRVYSAYNSRLWVTTTEKSQGQGICSREQREWTHPCAYFKLLPVLYSSRVHA